MIRFVRPIPRVVAMHTGGMRNSEPSPNLPEPWMRDCLPDVHPLLAPVLYSFQQAVEDLLGYTEGLTPAQLWATPYGFGSVAFHIRHITGSINRLMTYLQGQQLSSVQMAALQAEAQPDSTGRDELLAELDRVRCEAQDIIRALDPSTLTERRTVGRKKLPTTVIGLLTHIAEHTQRHVGQAISAAKLASNP